MTLALLSPWPLYLTENAVVVKSRGNVCVLGISTCASRTLTHQVFQLHQISVSQPGACAQQCRCIQVMPCYLLQHMMLADMLPTVCVCMQDDEGHVNWGVLLFSLLCIACGAVWLGLLRTWCALGSSCLSCPRRQRQVSAASLSVCNKLQQAHIALLHVCGRQRQVGATRLSVCN